MLERWHKGGNCECKVRSNQKIILRLLVGMLVLSLFSFGCSSSEKAFVEDEDTSVDEAIESTGAIDVTDSPPVDEADPEEITSLDDEMTSDEEVLKRFHALGM